MDIQRKHREKKRKELRMKLEIHESNKQRTQKRNLGTDWLNGEINKADPTVTNWSIEEEHGFIAGKWKKIYLWIWRRDFKTGEQKMYPFKVLGESEAFPEAILRWCSEWEPGEAQLRRKPTCKMESDSTTGCQPFVLSVLFPRKGNRGWRWACHNYAMTLNVAKWGKGVWG